MIHRVTAIFLTAALALGFVACSPKSEDESQKGPTRNTTNTQAANAQEPNARAMNPPAPIQKELPSTRIGEAAPPEIQVEVTEYAIRIPPQIPAGHQTLTITNSGKETHSLVLEANGHQYALPEPLARGARGSLNLELTPGTYNVYCPMPGHKAKGMSTSVVVK
jgi:plastocyanin